MKAGGLVIWYSLFAGVSIAINIGAQIASMAVYRGMYAIAISMIVGTIAGLVCKYILDKKYIFSFRSRDATHELKTFLLYSLMGVVTTALFWATELGFHYAFNSELMRYVGGIIGLTFGYFIKYLLDRSLVFK